MNHMKYAFDYLPGKKVFEEKHQMVADLKQVAEYYFEIELSRCIKNERMASTISSFSACVLQLRY